MSTRAILAAPLEDGPIASFAPPQGFFARIFGRSSLPKLRGVYFHNAGGPSEVGPVLFQVVQARHGGRVREAVRELIDENPAGWSSLYFFADAERAKAWDGKTKLTVEQHQDYFNRDEPAPGPSSFQGDPMRDLGARTPPIGTKTDKMGASFVYVLAPDELVMYAVGDDGVSIHEFARRAWSDAAPDWDAADEAAESAFAG